MNVSSPRTPWSLVPRLALGEILNNKSFSAWFAFSLALGLTGFLTLDALRGSLAAHLDQGSRTMLGADLGIYAQRPLTDRKSTRLNSSH